MTPAKIVGLAIATGLALAPFSSPAQAYTVTTSFSNWQAVLSGYVITTDPMDTVIASAQTILLDSGITSTNSGPITLPNPPYNNNSVNASGIYNNAVQGGSGVGVTASNTINWIFPSPVVAFGAFFQSASSDIACQRNDDGEYRIFRDHRHGSLHQCHLWQRHRYGGWIWHRSSCVCPSARSPARPGRFSGPWLVPSLETADRATWSALSNCSQS
jgi:hypothetical protein